MNYADLLLLESYDYSGAGTAGAGRGGSYGNPGYSRTLPSSPSVVYAGTAIQSVGEGPYAYVIQLQRSDFDSHRIEAIILGDGRVMVTGNGTPQLSSRIISDPIFNGGVGASWFFVEVIAIHLNAADNLGQTAMTVRVNEVVVAQTVFTNVKTAPAGKSGWNTIFGGRGGGTTPWFDDLYVSLDSYFGDGRVKCLYPASDATPNEWTALGGGAHYAEVDEHSPDNDTSYLNTLDTNKTERFGLDAPVDADEVQGIQLVARAYSEDTGKCRFQVDVDGTMFEYDNDFEPVLAWGYFKQPFRCDPNDGEQITPAELAALIAGFRRRL